MNARRTRLLYREKALLATFIILFFTFFTLAYRAQRQAGPFAFLSLHRSAGSVCVLEIRGAVAKPGRYSVRPETPVSAILKKARPLAHADLKGLHLERTCREVEFLSIPALKEFCVYIREEGKPEVALVVPLGTRVFELKKKIDWGVEADLALFKSRRKVKHDEIFRVPRKFS